MTWIGQPERATQKRVVKLFTEELGYRYYGDWQQRENNSNIEVAELTAYLRRKGYADGLIDKAIRKLREATQIQNGDLYAANQETYHKLRYGAQVKPSLSENTQTVHFIDWNNPLDNDFAIAEEVTLIAEKEKRPDIVLYVNGIAIGVLELKNARRSIGEGIRQNIVNQRADFIQFFFSTIQFVFAGNDTEGLRYGTTGTTNKWFLSWKEDIEDNSRLQLDKYLLKMCDKARLIELMHDFILFDGGVKKLPRPHQYFGIKAAREAVRKREGGIIWHTQGSGKSISMVYLARWITETNPNARVAILTDREELDQQIQDVFEKAGETIARSTSGKNLLLQLSKATPRLLCSLIHKFGRKDVDDFEAFIKDLENEPPKVAGEIFVFVDECHRTQGGKLHRTMKAILPGAVFIGFTGTPLLKKDKKTSLEVFGRYIHTYKFNEAVEDGIVHDLVYEARDIDQEISSPGHIDRWFAAKTQGLNAYQKGVLKARWGTMQKVLSSRSRMEKIVQDIILDFATRPRLSRKTGNAILVAGSIYEACRYHELFRQTPLGNACAVVTSYKLSTRDIVTEDTGENTQTERQYIYESYAQLLKDVQPAPKKTAEETYVDAAKKRFVDEPAQMRLLIVVDKLLTGFDAPPCSVLYIDKRMQDHGLFQAICRVNRLDGEDKLFGYIIDYKKLFESVKGAIHVYTSELEYDDFKPEDCDILLQNRLEKGRERLENAREVLALLCEPVATPRTTQKYIRYFCGNTEVPADLQATETRRIELYKGVVSLVRAIANIADDLAGAGYSESEIAELDRERNHYMKLREEIKRASGEELDLKPYEADMRYLIDHYINATDAETVGDFGGLPLLEVIANTGIDDAIGSLPPGIRGNREAVAETIENNVRQKIIRERLLDPAFYEEMSRLLAELVKERKQQALEYAEYLRRIAALATRVQAGKPDDTPASLNTPGKRALYNNLGKDLAKTQQVHAAVIVTRRADWRGDPMKENEIKAALYKILGDVDEVERIFAIVKEQAEY